MKTSTSDFTINVAEFEATVLAAKSLPSTAQALGKLNKLRAMLAHKKMMITQQVEKMNPGKNRATYNTLCETYSKIQRLQRITAYSTSITMENTLSGTAE